MANVYVARRRLRVGGRDVMPGDEVPEAGGWRHLPVYVRNGSVALVQTDVTYARGMNQRRPTAGRDDYRKKGLEHWYGEIRYGDDSGGSGGSVVISSVTPDPASLAVDNNFTVRGTGFVTNETGAVSISATDSSGGLGAPVYASNFVLVDDTTITATLVAGSLVGWAQPGPALLELLGNEFPWPSYAFSYTA